jgi:isopenicillin-N epimerase
LLHRRDFLGGAGASAIAAALLPTGTARAAAAVGELPPPPLSSTSSWTDLRQHFLLTPKYLHFANMLLASHPYMVRTAIEKHRRELDDNPALAVEPEHGEAKEARVRAAAGRYLGARPEAIALTDSTTMGLGLVYTGLRLRAGEAALFTDHEHYSSMEALRFAADRHGARLDRVRLYDNGGTATEGEIVRRLMAGIRPETRVVALTWVHSSTGVKLPLAAIATALSRVNRQRRPAEQILMCVDGVHGFGVEAFEVTQLGCDIFIAGCHKWLFGPRGTGLVWARDHAFGALRAAIPPFERHPYIGWLKGTSPDVGPPGPRLTPGGFHSYDHRWALDAAFEMHLLLGKARIQARVHELASQVKQGLKRMPKVTLRTPISPALSSGIICFEIAGRTNQQVVARLLERGIIASTTPYATSYARLSTGLYNTPDEIDRVLRELRALA